MKCIIAVFMAIQFIPFQGKGQLTIVYESGTIKYDDLILKEVPEFSEQNIRYRYSLYIDKGVSKFSRDSLYIISFPGTKDIQSYWPFKDVYKDYNKDSWISACGDYKKGYALAKSISSVAGRSKNFNWEITSEKKNIAGISCIKAISPSRNSVAYYAPELPYPDGPEDGIFSLPGLVLYYETPHETWMATEVILHKDSLQIPELITVFNEREITLSYDEVRKLGSENVIIADKRSPKGQWLKFKR